MATEGLESYTGGIYSECHNHILSNHIVSIIGFGEENGVAFWHVRNSWGAYYGEQGLFRIVQNTGNDDCNLGIEHHCHWGGKFFVLATKKKGRFCFNISFYSSNKLVKKSIKFFEKKSSFSKPLPWNFSFSL